MATVSTRPTRDSLAAPVTLFYLPSVKYTLGMSLTPGPRQNLTSKPSAPDAEFRDLRRRLLRLAKQRVGNEEGFRATRGVVALAVERYADCARAGQAGFNKRVGVVVRGCSSKYGSPLHMLRRTDPNIAEEEDEACLRVWIGVLQRLSGKHRESGLPGPNIIGGGRLGGRARQDEIEVNGLFYSPKRWRQLAEDSAVACGVLAELERAATSVHSRTGDPVLSNQEIDGGIEPTKTSAPRDEPNESRFPVTPVVHWSDLLRELKAANNNQRIVTAHTIRTWLRLWRESAGAERPQKKGIPVSHLRGMAEWLASQRSPSLWIVKPLLQVVQSRIGRESDALLANRTLEWTSNPSD